MSYKPVGNPYGGGVNRPPVANTGARGYGSPNPYGNPYARGRLKTFFFLKTTFVHA